MARTPVAIGVRIGCRPSGLGGASVMRAVREVLSDRARWTELSTQALQLAQRMHPGAQLEALTAYLQGAYPRLAQLPARG